MEAIALAIAWHPAIGIDALTKAIIGVSRPEIALSRRKQGFESPRERQYFQVLVPILRFTKVGVRQKYGIGAPAFPKKTALAAQGLGARARSAFRQ
jgi:hypothetical protein